MEPVKRMVLANALLDSMEIPVQVNIPFALYPFALDF
jgi:hypothetical protein